MSASTSIDNLEAVWRSVIDLCAGLTPEEWATATGCPGWSVQDQVAHLVDYEEAALGRPRPDHVPTPGDHVRNPLGAANEVGVDHRRSRTGAEVLAELREVTATRLAQLRSLGPADLEREVVTPAGPGTVADALTLRVMDTWSHELDIRRALQRPGHVDGPVVDEAVGYWARFLPLIVGKRAAAPDGASVRFDLGAGRSFPIVVEGGRARPVEVLPGEPTVVVAMPAPTFAALVGGRTDAPDGVVLTGDEALGEAVVAALAFLP